jgi:hypothetical protein
MIGSISSITMSSSMNMPEEQPQLPLKIQVSRSTEDEISQQIEVEAVEEVCNTTCAAVETTSCGIEDTCVRSSSDTIPNTTTNTDIVSKVQHGRAWDGMCCLGTMEDITDENYVEYQSFPSMVWMPSLFERCVVQELLETQFTKYLERVQTTDCMSELTRLVSVGPPIYLSDPHALPLASENDTHICQLWYSCPNSTTETTTTDIHRGEYHSAILHGAKVGKEREELWDQLKTLLTEQLHQKKQQEEQEEDEQLKKQSILEGKKEESNINTQKPTDEFMSSK